MRWLLLAVVVLSLLSGCECGMPSGMDAGVDASVIVEVDAGRDAGPTLDGSVTVSFDGSFGDVVLGSFVDHDGLVQNGTSSSVQVALSLADAGLGFSITDGGAFSVAPGAEGGFTVRFAPTTFGPVQEELLLNGAVITMRGNGTGASLRVPSTVDFGTVPLYAGPPAIDERLILLENVGAGVDVQLTFEVVAIDGDVSELCVADCFPGITRVRPGEPFEVSLRLTAPSVGMRRYEVRVFSNDLAEPLKTITVTANVVARPTCNFSLGAALDFGTLSEREERRLALNFENVGTEPCELSSADLSPLMPPVSGQLFTIETPAAFPVVVAPGFSTPILVRANATRPSAAGTFSSSLSIGINSPQHYAVTELRAQLAQACRFVGLSRPLDFGEVTTGCSSAARPLEALSSGCSGGVSAPVFGSLGPQFQLSVPPLAPSIRFTPIAVGPLRDVLRVDWDWNTMPHATTVELLGTGVANAQRTDTFTVPAQEKADLLFVIANHSGMQAYDATLKARLPPLVPALQLRNVDFHLGVISAGASRDQGALRITPNAQHFITSVLPNAQQRFTELLDVTGVGSLADAGDCKEAALRALAFPAIGSDNFGFRRADAALQIICITNQPDADDALGPQVMELARYGSFTWHAIAPTNPNPPCMRTVSATGHALLTGLTGGARDEICGDWSVALDGIARGLTRSRFTLTTPPDAQPIEVRINGMLVPQMSGMQNVWSFDSVANAVVFTPSFVPAPGDMVTVTYSAQCAP